MDDGSLLDQIQVTVVRKGMQATGGRWPVAVSIQATGEGDASKQREENEKQARGGEMQEQNSNSDLCFGKDPVHSEDRREPCFRRNVDN